MDKRKKVEDFLWYGGNELFSTLMGNAETRSAGVDRLVQLLQKYSDSCRWIKGRSGAYRFMLKKAVRYGWLGKDSADLSSHKLTKADREYIIKHLDDYILSGGNKGKLIRKAAIIGLIILIIASAVFMIARYMYSKEYGKKITDLYKEKNDYKNYVMNNEYTVPDGANVVFIGNSLTGRGGLADYFAQMVADRNINVTEMYVDGISLAEMYDIIKNKQEWCKIVESAECIILQDYGGKSDPAAIKNILELDPKLEHAYFFLTDFCISISQTENDYPLHLSHDYSDISKKTDYDVTPVGWGYISMQMCDKFGWKYFYYDDGYHPTELNGVVTAMLFYCFLTGERCEGVHYKLPSNLYTYYDDGELERLLGEAETEVSDFYYEVMGIKNK